MGVHACCTSRWRGSVHLRAITAHRLFQLSLPPPPTRFPVLRQPDVSQMFLTSCLAPCSACVCLFWTAH